VEPLGGTENQIWQRCPDSVDTYNWEDSWRYSVGGIFKPMEALELRAGVAFDETPIPNAQRRTPRVPGEDRTWLTFGAGYQFSELIKVDFAYGHLWIDDPKINKDPTDPENTAKGALIGEYDSSIDIFSASVSFNFSTVLTQTANLWSSRHCIGSVACLQTSIVKKRWRLPDEETGRRH
jgi:long-subunit fatty acid transport protein